MSVLSVQVTNAVYGRPADGIPVRVYQRLYDAWESGWAETGAHRTDVHGRLAVSLDGDDETLTRIDLDVDAYFATLGVAPAYPVIMLVFRATGQRATSRVCLLVSPSVYVTSLEV